jgi:hypothetical protein
VGADFDVHFLFLPTEKENGIDAVNRVKRDMSDDV